MSHDDTHTVILVITGVSVRTVKTNPDKSELQLVRLINKYDENNEIMLMDRQEHIAAILLQNKLQETDFELVLETMPDMFVFY